MIGSPPSSSASVVGPAPCDVVAATVDAEVDESHGVYFPSAPAVLIDVDSDPPLHGVSDNNANIGSRSSSGRSSSRTFNPSNVGPTHPHHGGSGTNRMGSNGSSDTHEGRYYASAQVVGAEISPFNPQVSRALTTYVEAVPLDPWSKAPCPAAAGHGGPHATTDGLATSAAAAGPTGRDGEIVATPDSFGADVHPSGGDHPWGAEAEQPWEKKLRRRRRRRGRMVVGGTAGFLAGMFVLGPLGGLAGAAAGAAVSRTTSKIGERRKDRRVERERQRQRLERGGGGAGTGAAAVAAAAVASAAPRQAYATAD